jgi:hypothetical protein
VLADSGCSLLLQRQHGSCSWLQRENTMVHSLLRWLAPAALLATACAAPAQTTLRVPRPDPLDPQATVPALKYESAFGPRRTADDKPLSWREANDNVARIGGWRVYAREAQQPGPAAVAPATPASAGAIEPMPHHDHSGQKKP